MAETTAIRGDTGSGVEVIHEPDPRQRGVLSDDTFVAALREPRRNRISFFYAALQEHRGHATFRPQDWVFSREMGFTCACDGTEREWRIDLSSLREMVPEARRHFERMRAHFSQRGNKKLKKKQRRARRKSRALLHQFLTQEQRWDLRATKSFEVIAQDGHAYQITEGTCNNVRRIEANGSIRWCLCVVAVGPATTFNIDLPGGIPVYDLMLMQKLLLESDLELFLKTACATDLRTREHYPCAEFLLTGDEPPSKKDLEDDNWRERAVPLLRNLPDEVLEDPEPWLPERMAAE